MDQMNLLFDFVPITSFSIHRLITYFIDIFLLL
jgi:hypothetical protein